MFFTVCSQTNIQTFHTVYAYGGILTDLKLVHHIHCTVVLLHVHFLKTYAGMLSSRPWSRSREHSRPLLCSLGLGLGLDTYGLGLEGSVSNIFKTSSLLNSNIFCYFNRKTTVTKIVAYTCVVNVALARLTIQYNTIQYKTCNAPYVTRMLFVGAGMRRG